MHLAFLVVMGISPRGGRDLDEKDDAVFYRAFVLHLGELAVDVLLRIVVGQPLGADFRAVKRAVRKAYPSLCRDRVHETKAVRRRDNTSPVSEEANPITHHGATQRPRTADTTPKGRRDLAEAATNAVRRAAGEKALETIRRKAT